MGTYTRCFLYGYRLLYYTYYTLGKIVFAIGCGVLTALIRVKGGMPEGVSYSILLMNIMTPIIERFTRPRVFGGAK